MLRQQTIELDVGQIKSIHQNEKRKKNRQQQMQQQRQQSNKKHAGGYCIVREQIFPSRFTPFFIDPITKQTALQIYSLQLPLENIQTVNQKLKFFYLTLNRFPNHQRDKIAKIVRVNEIKQFTEQINQKITVKQTQKTYFFYFQSGKSLQDIQIWRFKHSQDKTPISYQSRQQIINDYLLVVRFIDSLLKTMQFQNIPFAPNNLLIHQYQSLYSDQMEYFFIFKLQWLLNLIFNKYQQSKKENVLISLKKILLKLLCIDQEKDKRSKLDEIHFTKIQSISSIEEIFKINYEDFYHNTNKKISNTQNQLLKEQKFIRDKQKLQALKSQILHLQEQAKKQIKQIKQIKTLNHNPKVTFESQQSKIYFQKQIKKIIQKNITQIQRKDIILNAKNKIPQKIKDKKLATTPLKSPIKEAKKQETKILEQQNKHMEQVQVQFQYLASASDLKLRPQNLIKLISQKSTMFYLLRTYDPNSKVSNHIGCYINAKATKQTVGLLGSYFQDPFKKSFIYSEKTDNYYQLIDKNHAVGYGPQVFFSIGKLDIIVPCFGTVIIDNQQILKCMSYFPISFSSQGNPIQTFGQIEQNQISNKNQKQKNPNPDKQNQLGLQRQFLLSQIDIYEVSFKVI